MFKSVLLSVISAAETLNASNDDLIELFLRMALFMLALLIFVLLCGLAWRTIPALRALVPSPQQVEEMEAENREDEEFSPSRSINLMGINKAQVNAETETELTGDITSSGDTVQEQPVEEIKLPPEVELSPIERLKKPRPGSPITVGEGIPIQNDLDIALSDGSPGTVVKAASDIDGVNSNAPIVYIHRNK